jgi:hypothetical protein
LRLSINRRKSALDADAGAHENAECSAVAEHSFWPIFADIES